MIVETYSPRYYLDIVDIIKNFHDESLNEYDSLFDPNAVVETITALEKDHSLNAFLLIDKNKCQGLLFGFEIKSNFNNKRTFQEMIWYVNESHRRYGVKLLNIVKDILKDRGIDNLIMSCMENSKTEKLKALYEKMGFKKMETNYVISL